MDEYMGVIRLFAGPDQCIPSGWLICDGRLLPVSQYLPLFSLLKTNYGGDGKTTFGIPDLRGRIPVGAATPAGVPVGFQSIGLGETGGMAKQVLTLNTMPQHTHIATVVKSATATLNVSSANATNAIPSSGNVIATPGTSGTFNATLGFNTSAPNTNLNSASISVPTEMTNQEVGLSAAFSIMQPFLGLRYIICSMGVYPQPGE